jgi:hypothetical protein
LTPDLFDVGSGLARRPAPYVSERRHRQLVRSTLALRHEGVAALPAKDASMHRFRCFVSADDFKTYVSRELIVLAAAG